MRLKTKTMPCFGIILSIAMLFTTIQYHQPAAASDVSVKAPNSDLVEVTSLRTKYAKTYRDPNGIYTAEINMAPIHYKDTTGIWQDINTNLTLDKTTGKYINNTNSFTTVIGTTKDDSSIEIIDGDLPPIVVPPLMLVPWLT